MKKLSWKSDKLQAALLALAFLLASSSVFFQGLERKAYDWGVRVTQHEPNKNVVIVVIDDESIANIGRWPWSREVHARMFDLLHAAKPKVIGSTVLFLEPQTDPGLDYINKISDLLGPQANTTPLKALIAEAKSKLNPDAKLAASLHASNNVVLAMPFVLGEPPGNLDQPLADYVTRNALTFASDHTDGVAQPPLAISAMPPIIAAGVAASAIGHLNATPDIDGAIRVEPLFIQYQNAYYPSLALQVATRYLKLDAQQLQVFHNEVQTGYLHIATDAALRMNTYFYPWQNGRPPFDIDSFYDVLSGKINPEKYQGKIVLIGASAEGIGDRQVTPVSADMSPIETLAHSVSSILNEDFFTVPSWAGWAEFLVWFLVAAYLVLWLPELNASKAALSTAVFFFLLVIAHFFLMTQKNWWLQLAMPASLLIAGHVLLTTKRYWLTERGKQKAEAISAESNRDLALMFQSQGQLDMAFDRFKKCIVDDALLDAIYNLGLDFERKRQFNKAEAVFAYVGQYHPNYKDISQRISRSRYMSDTVILGGASRVNEGTLILGNGDLEKPMLGRYVVEKELGKGAMGVVYQGRDPKIGRVVAIKTMALSDEFEPEELTDVKARFFREAETAGRLNHPNIVTIYDAGEEHDLAYIAMELLNGEDLTSYTRPDNLLPQDTLLRIIIRVAEALEYAHSQHVIHRDIKPSNIMYDAQADVVKVTDFGIARITDTSKTKTGVVLGTPSYMSPEQLAGKRLDGRSDIFSLGVTLYSLLTGSLPFKADSMAALMYKIANEPHVDIRQLNPALDERLAMVVNKMLEKNVLERYQSCRKIAEDLQNILDERVIK
ncbi:MAG TPA: CHASE2 domain-containing protein [Methylophilus sp.]|nr:CHASE2 domain-containing protein [Methylophilus sp.]HQQ34031.1 CHASE2 domain-containing protein [Methylophilus sp.]